MKLYKYRSDIYRDLLAIVSNQIFIPTKDNLNDPAEVLFDDRQLLDNIKVRKEQKQIHESVERNYKILIEGIKKKVGIFSLSKNVTNELLWSYYSNGHNGFCIEYESEILKEQLKDDSFPFEIEVDYSQGIPDLSLDMYFSSSNNLPFLIQILVGNKSYLWAHEEEVRLITCKSGLLDINPNAVTGIYFGVKMSEYHKDLIMKVLKNRNISFFQMQLVPNSYALEFKQINNVESIPKTEQILDKHFTPKEIINKLMEDIVENKENTCIIYSMEDIKKLTENL